MLARVLQQSRCASRLTLGVRTFADEKQHDSMLTKIKSRLGESDASKAAKKAKRDQIIDEIRGGSFNEMHAAEKFAEGTSSTSLAPAPSARTFPALQTTALSGPCHAVTAHNLSGALTQVVSFGYRPILMAVLL